MTMDKRKGEKQTVTQTQIQTLKQTQTRHQRHPSPPNIILPNNNNNSKMTPQILVTRDKISKFKTQPPQMNRIHHPLRRLCHPGRTHPAPDPRPETTRHSLMKH